MDHARRFGLTFDTLKFSWGEAFDLAAVQQFLSRSPAVGWMWFVHGETSTGMLNPLTALQALCARRKIKLCVDCISSFGVTPVNLSGICMATASSGKGLGSYPGLGLAFHNEPITPCPKLPRYLDLGLHLENDGIAFTHSSNLTQALHVALRRVDWARRYVELAADSAWLRAKLRAMGLTVIAPELEAMPAVISLAPMAGQNGIELAQRMELAGYLLSCNSNYLRRRDWVQICLMGEYSREKLDGLLAALVRFSGFRSSAGQSAAAAPSLCA